MEIILAHAHTLMYTLLALLLSYQRDNLEAMLGLFLAADRKPLPHYSKAKSESALSRFLNTIPVNEIKIPQIIININPAKY